MDVAAFFGTPAPPAVSVPRAQATPDDTATGAGFGPVLEGRVGSIEADAPLEPIEPDDESGELPVPLATAPVPSDQAPHAFLNWALPAAWPAGAAGAPVATADAGTATNTQPPVPAGDPVAALADPVDTGASHDQARLERAAGSVAPAATGETLAPPPGIAPVTDTSASAAAQMVASAETMAAAATDVAHALAAPAESPAPSPASSPHPLPAPPTQPAAEPSLRKAPGAHAGPVAGESPAAAESRPVAPSVPPAPANPDQKGDSRQAASRHLQEALSAASPTSKPAGPITQAPSDPGNGATQQGAAPTSAVPPAAETARATAPASTQAPGLPPASVAQPFPFQGETERPAGSIAAALETFTRLEAGSAPGHGGRHFDGEGGSPSRHGLAQPSVQDPVRMMDIAGSVDRFALPSDVATPETEATTARPRTPELGPQIIKQIHLQWKGGIGEARIRLNPEHLGELVVDIEVGPKGVVASLASQSPVVRSWIESHQHDLREALEQQGLRLHSLTVNDEPDQQRRRQPEQEPRDHARGRSSSAQGGEPPAFELSV